MLIMLHADQAQAIRAVARDLNVSAEEATRMLLSGALLAVSSLA